MEAPKVTEDVDREWKSGVMPDINLRFKNDANNETWQTQKHIETICYIPQKQRGKYKSYLRGNISTHINPSVRDHPNVCRLPPDFL